jgi:hypothetical protein
MAYTFPTLTDVATGDVLTAVGYNNVQQTSRQLRVPPACEVYRTSNLTGYTSNTAITWQAERYDTDGMWTSGSSVTIQTPGIYVITLNVGITATATVTLMTAGIYISGQLSAQTYANVANGNDSYASVSAAYSLAAAQTVTAACAFVGGSNYAIVGSATAYAREQARLSVAWLGQVS